MTREVAGELALIPIVHPDPDHLEIRQVWIPACTDIDDLASLPIEGREDQLLID
jgi:hypothetical protein